jgi:hypothetical protein
MAIERHDGYGPAVDGGAARTEGGDRPARPLGERSTGDRAIPEERRSRGELHAALRAKDTGTDSAPRPGHRDAPRTTPDGAWEWKGLRLEPDANRLADRELSARRSAEGRDADGKYGDRGITPAMRRVEAKLEHGALVPDTEKFALKTPARFKEKLAKMIGRRPDSSASELANEISDGIRYTFLFDAHDYIDGVKEACAVLAGDSYQLVTLANRWDGEEYKGINSRWLDIRSGQPFEVQFHTPESWDAKQKTHDAYEKIDNPVTPVGEIETLRAYQRTVTGSIKVPDRWKEIDEYRKPRS